MSLDINDPRLTAYALGELEGEERQAVEAALAASPALRDEVEKIRTFSERLARELSAEPAPTLTESQRAAVFAAAKAELSQPAPREVVAHPRPRPNIGQWAVGLLAIAGSLLIAALVGGGFLWQRIQVERATRELALARQAEETARIALQDNSGSMEQRLPSAHWMKDDVQFFPMGTEFKQAPSTRLATSAEQSAPPFNDVAAAERSTRGRKRTAMGDYGSGEYGAGMEGMHSRAGSGNGLEGSDMYGGMYGMGGYGSTVVERQRASGREYTYSGKAPGPQITIGLDPTGQPTADLDIPFTQGAFGGAIPAHGGFDPNDPQAAGLGGYPHDPHEGRGPGEGGDRHDPIVENPFKKVTDEPLSTFSIDVDTAAYSKVRQYLLEHRRLPPADAVRIEELVNYFAYDYEPPSDGAPFAARMEVAECPWNAKHRLARVAIKGREIERGKRPSSNLVFLLDVSGSMTPANKLPLVKEGMRMLIGELGENDRVAIVVYAGAAGLVLDSTTGDRKSEILSALDRLHAGGSTNGGDGIRLAYQTALDHFIAGGVNRVILCTDGDFNVGTTSTGELVRIVEENAKTGVFLSVLGFGMGNHNDSLLEQISNKGNGNYAFIDTQAEARKTLVEQMSGTLVTIAKDVKIQIEFNPAQVAAYRLIGYENRILAAQDFNDDKKDAGEIGAGHTVTALYELVPADAESDVETPPVDELKYQKRTDATEAAASGELLTLKLRYKEPDGDTSKLLSYAIKDDGKRFTDAGKDFRFAAAVASFGMTLRGSKYKGDATLAALLEIASEAAEPDPSGYRQEFLTLVKRAKELRGE